jgi:transposase
MSHLESITYLKVEEICSYVEEMHGMDYIVSEMTTWLHDHNFSYNKLKGTPAKVDPTKQEAFIVAYESLVKRAHFFWWFVQ